MSFPEGAYSISTLTNGDSIGLDSAQDPEPGPQSIYALPFVPDPDSPDVIWGIKPVGEDSYELLCGPDGWAIELDGFLYANTSGDGNPVVWKIEDPDNTGRYKIVNFSNGHEWVVNVGGFQPQVAVQPPAQSKVGNGALFTILPLE